MICLSFAAQLTASLHSESIESPKSSTRNVRNELFYEKKLTWLPKGRLNKKWTRSGSCVSFVLNIWRLNMRPMTTTWITYIDPSIVSNVNCLDWNVRKITRTRRVTRSSNMHPPIIRTIGSRGSSHNRRLHWPKTSQIPAPGQMCLWRDVRYVMRKLYGRATWRTIKWWTW